MNNKNFEMKSSYYYFTHNLIDLYAQSEQKKVYFTLTPVNHEVPTSSETRVNPTISHFTGKCMQHGKCLLNKTTF